MSLDDRIRTTLAAAVDELRGRLEQDLRALGDRLVAEAAAERDAVEQDARAAALRETEEETRRQVSAAEDRMRATIDDLVTQARNETRHQATEEVRRLVELESAERLEHALADADHRMRQALSAAEAKADEALQESVAAARVREREFEMAAVTRLLDSVRGLDGASSLSEVLDALGQAAGREAARAAVLVLRNDRLLGWKLSGFGTRDTQPKSIDLSLSECGVIGMAVGTARAVTTRDGDAAAEGPGFAALPADRMGLAVPVIVGGRVVAVVYADSVSQDTREHVVPSGWPEVIEILARHAARVLEALTVQKTAASPSPRFWVPPGKGAAPPQSAGAGGTGSPPDPASRVP
jgi:hypothetical protein